MKKFLGVAVVAVCLAITCVAIADVGEQVAAADARWDALDMRFTELWFWQVDIDYDRGNVLQRCEALPASYHTTLEYAFCLDACQDSEDFSVLASPVLMDGNNKLSYARARIDEADGLLVPEDPMNPCSQPNEGAILQLLGVAGSSMDGAEADFDSAEPDVQTSEDWLDLATSLLEEMESWDSMMSP